MALDAHLPRGRVELYREPFHGSRFLDCLCRNWRSASEDQLQDTQIVITDFGQGQTHQLDGHGYVLDGDNLFEAVESLLQLRVDYHAIRVASFTRCPWARNLPTSESRFCPAFFIAARYAAIELYQIAFESCPLRYEGRRDAHAAMGPRRPPEKDAPSRRRQDRRGARDRKSVV